MSTSNVFIASTHSLCKLCLCPLCLWILCLWTLCLWTLCLWMLCKHCFVCTACVNFGLATLCSWTMLAGLHMWMAFDRRLCNGWRWSPISRAHSKLLCSKYLVPGWHACVAWVSVLSLSTLLANTFGLTIRDVIMSCSLLWRVRRVIQREGPMLMTYQQRDTSRYWQAT